MIPLGKEILSTKDVSPLNCADHRAFETQDSKCAMVERCAKRHMILDKAHHFRYAN